MAVWELALIIFAATYMMVNMVYLAMLVKQMSKLDGIFTKGCKMMEKLMDKSEKYIDEMFDDEDL